MNDMIIKCANFKLASNAKRVNYVKADNRCTFTRMAVKIKLCLSKNDQFFCPIFLSKRSMLTLPLKKALCYNRELFIYSKLLVVKTFLWASYLIQFET